MIKAQGTDKTHTIQQLINSAPTDSGGLTAITDTVWNPMVEQRRARWSHHVIEALEELESEIEGLVNKLSKDQEFLSLLMNATQIAIKSHQEEKYSYLKNGTYKLNARENDV